MALGGAAKGKVIDLRKIKSEKTIQLLEGEVMDMSLLTREPFAAEYFPTAMEMIIQGHGPEKDTARFFPQDAMHLAHGD